jgi:diguanylate cyclase (GGDEF)-like protein
MRVAVLLLALTVVASTAATRLLLLWPMSMDEKAIRADDRLIPGGAAELRTLTDAYNDIYDASHFREESLSYEANHDALTGVYNRGAFDNLLTVHKHECALMLVDVDNFKHFNDDYGHDMGDAILIEVAATLYASFRSTDHVCRIGGDEFAVIMVNVGSELRDVIAHKIGKVTAFLRDTSNGLPAVTISVGVAFGDGNCSDDELFRRADEALYSVKQRGRDGFAFHGED